MEGAKTLLPGSRSFLGARILIKETEEGLQDTKTIKQRGCRFSDEQKEGDNIFERYMTIAL